MCGTHSKWTRTNNELFVRCVVNGISNSNNSSSTCMRRQLLQKHKRSPNQTCAHQYKCHVTYNHLLSVHFVFIFASHTFSVDYTFEQNAYFLLLSSWKIFEPILGFLLYVHVSHQTLYSQRWVNTIFDTKCDAGLAK